MACIPIPDDEGAVRVVEQVYELIKANQPMLVHRHQPPLPKLAQTLLDEALRGLNVALSVMKQQMQPAPTAADPVILPAPGSNGKRSTGRTGKRRRSMIEGNTWVLLTTMPYNDGYQWRKYGEKNIQGNPFARNYFRCTNKNDQGCKAKKNIQKINNNDPPMFEVTYNHAHTCNWKTVPTNNESSSSSSNDVPFLGYCDSGRHISPNENAVNLKEQPLPLPPAKKVSSLPLDQMHCHEPFDVSGHHLFSSYHNVPSIVACISAGISGDDEYVGTGHMAPQLEPLDDYNFFDPGLFLIDDSFKYC